MSDNEQNMKWFVIQTSSGYEARVQKTLIEQIKRSNCPEKFGDVIIPTEEVVEVKNGVKRKSERKFFPGYILVQMRLNQDTWHLVKETPKISGFVGDVSDPAPLKEEDVALINTQVEEGAMSSRSKVDFEQGETVKVIDGPFNEFTGTVEEIKADKGKLVVLISIFGRPSPVELDFIQVEKC